MAAVNPPFVIQDQSHASDIFRRVVKVLRSQQGVDAPGDMAVSQNGTPNMSVNVAAGLAVVDGTQDATHQGAYGLLNDATLNLAIAAADPTNPRIDIVVAKVQDSQYSGATDAWALAVVTGTAAPSPAPPAAPANSIILAQVAVAALAASIVNANITDLRPFIDGALFPGGSGWSLFAADGTSKNAAVTDAGVWTFRNALTIPPSAAGTPAASSYGSVPVKFAETLLGASAATVTFSSIPSNGRTLTGDTYLRSDRAAALDTLDVRFNNDSAANYDSQKVSGSGATASATEVLAGNGVLIGDVPANTATANYFGSCAFRIPQYAGGTGNKSVTSHSHAFTANTTGTGFASAQGGKWRTVATAINRLDFLSNTGSSFVAGSFFGISLQP